MISNIIRQPAISLLRKNGNEALIRSQTLPEILVVCILPVHMRDYQADYLNIEFHICFLQ